MVNYDLEEFRKHHSNLEKIEKGFLIYNEKDKIFAGVLKYILESLHQLEKNNA